MNKLLFQSALTLCVLGHAITSHSAVLTFNGDGLVTGATGVIVDGNTYSVSFIDGTFADVFGDISGLDAVTLDEATAFSQALLDQVYISTVDDDPSLVAGCTPGVVGLCDAVTPYDIDDSFPLLPSILGMGARNADAASEVLGNDILIGYNNFETIDFSSLNLVWADWSVTAVPVPAAAWLFGSALLGLGLSKRRTQ